MARVFSEMDSVGLTCIIMDHAPRYRHFFHSRRDSGSAIPRLSLAGGRRDSAQLTVEQQVKLSICACRVVFRK